MLIFDGAGTSADVLADGVAPDREVDMDIRVSGVSSIDNAQPSQAAKKDAQQVRSVERDYTSELLRQKAQLRDVSKDPSLSASERATKQREIERKVSELAKQERLQQQKVEQEQHSNRAELPRTRTENNHVEAATRAKSELESSSEAKTVAEKVYTREALEKTKVDAEHSDNAVKDRSQNDADAVKPVPQSTDTASVQGQTSDFDTDSISYARQVSESGTQGASGEVDASDNDDGDNAGSTGLSAEATEQILSDQITNTITEQKARVQFTLTKQGDILRGEIDADRGRRADNEAQEKRLEDIYLRMRGIPGQQQQEEAQQMNIILPGAA